MVDNGSTDGSVDDGVWYPGVRLLQTGRNLGFAGGVNAGLEDLGELYAVALVNSDAFVEPGWLRPLADACTKTHPARRRRPEAAVRVARFGRAPQDQQRG